MALLAEIETGCERDGSKEIAKRALIQASAHLGAPAMPVRGCEAADHGWTCTGWAFVEKLS